MVERLPGELDRSMALAERLPDPDRPAAAEFLISDNPLPATWELRATTVPATAGHAALVRRSLQWFATHISKRKAGDQLQVPDTLYLYRLPPQFRAGQAPEKGPSSAHVEATLAH